MTDYTKTTNFAAKDSLPSGNANKIVKGTEIDTEFNNIATASATKADIASPTFTGTVTIPTADINGGAVDGTTIGASSASSIVGTTIVANTSISIAGDGATVTGIKDEDDMSSNSATKLATQQSIKAYVDNQITAQDLDVTDGSSSIDIDLDSESLGILGGTGIDSTASGTGVTLAIDSTVATLTGSQTLTNKTLTAPTLTGTAVVASLDISGDVDVDGTLETDALSINGTTVTSTAAELNILDGKTFLDEDDMSSNSATGIASQQSIKAYVDSQVATVDTLAEVLGNGNTTGGTDIAFGDNDKAIFGASSDLQIYHDSSTNDSIITETGAGNLVLQGDSLRLTNTSGVRYLQGNSGAEVNLWHNGNKKLETTSSGIDVTGSVTADGLTVDGDVAVASNLPSITLTDNNNSNSRADIEYNFGYLSIDADANNVDVAEAIDLKIGGNTHFRLATGGDISFYEDTGTTPKLFWDSSAESLGIGTSSPSYALDVNSGTTNTVARFTSTDSGAGVLLTDVTGSSKVETSGATLRISVDDDAAVASSSIQFRVDGSTKATIDDSGNLGIGTSSPSKALHVSDNSNFLVDVAGSDSAVVFKETGGNSWRIGNDSSTDAFVVSQSETSLGADVRFFIANGGNVGIGTSSPDTLLHLSDTAGGAVIRLERNDTTIASTNVYGEIQFEGQDASAGSAAGIRGKILGVAEGATGEMALAFQTASGYGSSTERLRIDSSGNLLVGKTSSDLTTDGFEVRPTGFVGVRTNGDPLYLNRKSTDGAIATFAKDGSSVGSIQTNGGRLDIQGAGNTVRIQSGTSLMQVTNGTQISFETAGTERLRIDASGNVLVGKTSSSTGTAGFEARANGQTVATVDGGTPLIANRKTSDGDVIRVLKGGSLVGSIGAESGNVYIQGNPATGKSGLTFYGSYIEPRDNGASADAAVDLGISSARFKDLYLSGKVLSAANNFYQLNDGSFGTVIQAAGGIKFNTSGGNERARIDSSGNLLVGTTSSNGRLTVQAATASDSAAFFKPNVISSGAGSSAVTMQIQGQKAACLQVDRYYSHGVIMAIKQNGGTVGSISVTGSTTAYNTSSDQRLKDNIVDAEDAGELIDAIQVRQFDWKADGSHQRYGMVAQELTTVAPEAVSTPEDPDEMMGVDYSKLVPMLIKEIQTLRSRVAQLEK